MTNNDEKEDIEKPKMIIPSAKAAVFQPKYKLQTPKLKKGKGSYDRKRKTDDS